MRPEEVTDVYRLRQRPPADPHEALEPATGDGFGREVLRRALGTAEAYDENRGAGLACPYDSTDGESPERRRDRDAPTWRGFSVAGPERSRAPRPSTGEPPPTKGASGRHWEPSASGIIAESGPRLTIRPRPASFS